MTPPALAHLGGAPEALTIGLPLLIFVGFMLAEKRARKREAQHDNDPRVDPSVDPPTSDPPVDPPATDDRSWP